MSFALSVAVTGCDSRDRASKDSPDEAIDGRQERIIPGSRNDRTTTED